MFTGFLKVGDVEIINDARAKGYAETAECPLSWHQCDCEGLADATGSGAFVHAGVHDAPWYDPRNPESKRFYGVTGLAFRDLASSTLQRDVVEGITNGGVAGQPRYAGKTVRVRAFLSADGEDALEYGMSWLKAAVASRRCNQHGISCGGTDLQFFNSCPPGRAIVEDYSPWEPVETNLATNPSFEVDAGLPVGTVRSTEWAAFGSSSLFVPFSDTDTLEISENRVTGLSPVMFLGDESDVAGGWQDGLYDMPSGTRLSPTASPGVFELGE